jgi:hypothetical protein
MYLARVGRFGPETRFSRHGRRVLLFLAAQRHNENQSRNRNQRHLFVLRQRRIGAGTATTDLAQQKLCAEGAKHAFEEQKTEFGKDVLSAGSDYANHYDAKTDTCYVGTRISISRPDKTGWGNVYSTIILVKNAFERPLFYAFYVWEGGKTGETFASAPDRDTRVRLQKGVVTCFVVPKEDKISCKTEDEFDALVNKHFGIIF